MKVYLHNMETGEDEEIEVPILCQLRIELAGTIAGRGRSKKIFVLNAVDYSDFDDVVEVLDLNVSEGRIYATARATNNWQLGIGD